MAKCDSTTVDVALLVVQAKHLRTAKVLWCERFIDLYQVNVTQRESSLAEKILNRRHRSDAHLGRVNTGHVISREAGQRSVAVLLDGLLTGQNERGSTVTDARGVGGSHSAVLLEDGREFAHLLQGGIRTSVFVVREHLNALARLQLNRCNLGIEHTSFVGLRPTLLTLESISIRLLTSDTILFSQVLCCDSHWNTSVTIGESSPKEILELGLTAKLDAKAKTLRDVWSAAHALRTADQGDLSLAQHNRLICTDGALEATATETVHTESRSRDGDTAAKCHVASQVGTVSRGTNHIAEDHFIDVGRVHLARCQSGL
mmetsp:Transcript_2751/g.8617  ORF Transcript_2751/g.8617 Transcript_2751/m.8617 type:complete len:316 (+) Transcript_2751:178-1125(+)